MTQRLYYLHTMPGIDPITWAEVSRRFGDVTQAGHKLVPQKNALLLFRSATDPQELLNLRTAEDLFVVVARGFKIAPGREGLRQIYAAVRHAKGVRAAVETWEDIYGPLEFPATFRLVVREVGAGNLMRRDIGQAVADGVLDGWPGRWRRIEEEADIELWVNLLGEELLVGLRLSRAEMRHRSYKIEHLPASLRPSVAAAMVQLTKPAGGDVFLDPMAGAGTILLERAAAGPFARLLGGDEDPDALDAMRANLRAVRGPVRVQEWDARALPLADASVDKVASNLPFGRQISPGANLRALYGDLLVELERVVRPDGLLVLLTGDAAPLDTALRAAPALRLLKRYPVNILGYDAVISVVGR